jgi:hypothetical protein
VVRSDVPEPQFCKDLILGRAKRIQVDQLKNVAALLNHEHPSLSQPSKQPRLQRV